MQRNQEANLMTKSTYDRLTRKLSALKEQVAEAGLRIGEAGGSSDWHDNFALDEAHRGKERLMGQVSSLKARLSSARLIRPNFSQDRVDLGHQVRLQINDEPDRFTILGPDDSEPERGWVSYLSPIGNSLLGKRKGEKFKFRRPDGLEDDITVKGFDAGEFE